MESFVAGGSGSMGEVYRARDTKLGREEDVYITGFGPDGERLVGARLDSPPARRIIVETGWSPEG